MCYKKGFSQILTFSIASLKDICMPRFYTRYN